MAHDGVVFALFLLFSLLSIASSYRCSNRLYRGQRLLPGEHLCSRNLQYRMLFNVTNGQVNISESFPRVKYVKPPPPTLFITSTSASVSQYLTVSDLGDFLAVSSDNSISWRVNVTDGSFLELQDTGVAVLFAVNTTTNITVVKWKSPSQYSLRLAGGTTTAGRVEALFNNAWGTVCNDAFDDYDAIVACRSLGFQSGVAVANTAYGTGSGPIWLTKMKCRKTEDSLQQCAFNDDEMTWGDTSPCTHSQDAAVSCTGSWTLGVPSPLQHVCVSRLYVGQTLSIGESLCGGVNGEYALRLTNKFGDTALVFEEKGKRRWMIGWKANTPAGVKATLGTDGVLRLTGSAAGLPYALFTQNITDAAFLDIQDDGTVKVVSRNGTVGWKKAANDYCYEDVKQADLGGHDLGTVAGSLMTCEDSCSSDSNCKSFVYSESAEWVDPNCARGNSCCYKKNGAPWDPVPAMSNYEKIVGCASGPACYTFAGNSNNPGFDISNNQAADLNACTALCDQSPRCNNVMWFPGNNPSCWSKWLQLNESRGNFPADYLFLRLSCTPVAPQSVSTTPPPSCPSQLQANGYLLKGERLCSPNGQHVLSVEPDGRLLLDAGEWTTGSPSGTTAALQLTDTKLLLRLDDGSVKWTFDWSKQTLAGSAGYLQLLDNGLLQLVNSFGLIIWNHLNGSLPLGPTWSVGGIGNAALLVDGDNSSCISRPSTSFLGLGVVPLNASFPVTVVGRKLKCDANNMGDAVTLMLDVTTDGSGGYKGRYVDCQLGGGNSTACRFQCQSAATPTLSIAIAYLPCGGMDRDSAVCEILLQ